MNIIVTGAAGFIGSRLCQRLLQDGHSVTGVDVLTDYYLPSIKENNLKQLQSFGNFKLLQEDILKLDWQVLYQNHEVVFHLAGQPGVRSSWGNQFSIYTRNNIEATQRMLQQAVGCTHLKKFVYASTSSIYGDAESFPTSETMLPKPVSPYGVTKLAGENLCYLYHRNYGVPTVSLRFFTVYGPGQRPDMAFHILLKSLVEKTPFTLYGDGAQTRDFTFVDDIVEGNILASNNGIDGSVYNLGGGNRVSMLDVLQMVEMITDKKINVQFSDRQMGDARNTAADIIKANQELGYSPHTSLQSGLKAEWEWIVQTYSDRERILRV